MKTFKYALMALVVITAAGCAGNRTSAANAGAQPTDSYAVSSGAVDENGIPEPIYGTEGRFMCPYTEDGVVAGWVNKSINAKVGGSAGNLVGRYAGAKLFEQIPFIGGWLGGKAGDAVGRKAALSMAGGWDAIRESSDLSFNSLNDMARYVAHHHTSHSQFQEVVTATNEIYPGFQNAYLAIYAQ